MKFIEIKSEKDLPPERKYVIGKHNRGWRDKDDQKNVNTVIVKLIKGLTEDDRLKMEKGELPNPLIKGWNLSEGTLFGNNEKPYYWGTFGLDSFFGQSITHWCEIPEIEKKEL